MILSGLIHVTVSCILLDIGFTLENVKRQNLSGNRFKNIVHDTISSRQVTKSDSEFSDVTRSIKLVQDDQNIVLQDKLADNYTQIIHGGNFTLRDDHLEVTESVLDVIEPFKDDTTTMAFKIDPFIDETLAMWAKKSSSTATDGIKVTEDENEPTIKEYTTTVDAYEPSTATTATATPAMVVENEPTIEVYTTTFDVNEPNSDEYTTTVDENEPTTEESTTTLDENEPTTEGATTTKDEHEPTTEEATTTDDEHEPTKEGSTTTFNENEPTTEGSTAKFEENEPTIEGSATTVDENGPTTEEFTATMIENGPTTEGSTSTTTVDENAPTTEESKPTKSESTPMKEKNDSIINANLAVIDEKEDTKKGSSALLDEIQIIPAKEVVEEQEDNDMLQELIKNEIIITTAVQDAFSSSQAPPIPEDVHTDELTTISQDGWIVANHKPPKISLLKANFSQSEKIDFSNNSKSLMPKSVAGIIPAVITPASTTVLPSTTTVPETQQQSSKKKIYKKCCQERQVVHLERGGVPYCERLHGVELPVLQPPSHSEVSGWGAGLMSIPVCINSSLSVLQDNYYVEPGLEFKSSLQTDMHSGKQEDYCIDFGIEDGSFIKPIALVCTDYSTVCQQTSCVNMCCGKDEYCNTPPGYFDDFIPRPFHLLCDTMKVNMSINSEGMFYHEEFLTSSEYCITQTGLMNDEYGEGEVCESRRNDNYYLYITSHLIMVLLLISVVSLLVSLMLHVLVPELRNSMFSWMKMSHLLAMFWSYLILFILYICGLDLVTEYPFYCKLLGFSLHFFFLASFFWVNVMSFDIWRTFRHMRGYGTMVDRIMTKKKKFIYYSVYAWGFPFLISMITLTIESIPVWLTENLITPGIGVQSCFFNTNWGKMLYFHAPVGVLLTANIIFFFLASWSLVFGVWAPAANDRIKRKTKQRFAIVVELFFVMGLTWIAEIASWAIAWGIGTKVVWKSSIVFDIANASQGFIIFLIVVMKSRIIRSIKRFYLGLPTQSSIRSSIKKFSSRRLSLFRRKSDVEVELNNIPPSLPQQTTTTATSIITTATSKPKAANQPYNEKKRS